MVSISPGSHLPWPRGAHRHALRRVGLPMPGEFQPRRPRSSTKGGSPEDVLMLDAHSQELKVQIWREVFRSTTLEVPFYVASQAPHLI